jgi:hypothetical protein
MYLWYAVVYCVEVRATSRKVAGPIRDGVIEIFNCLNPSGPTVALVSTEPLAEMSTRNLS